MKKLKLFVTAIIAMLVATVSVHATTLNMHSDLTELALKEDKVEENVHYVTATVKVNKDNINAILNYKAGHSGSNGEAYIGVFYFSAQLPVDFDGANGPKVLEKAGAHVTDKVSLEEAMKEAQDMALKQYNDAVFNSKPENLGNKLKDEYGNDISHDSKDTMWNLGVEVLYKDSATGEWKEFEKKDTGTQTIGAWIAQKVGVDSVSDEDYGTKFIFSVPEYKNLLLWRVTNTTNDNVVSEEWVQVTYDIEFPITASNGDRSYYYLTMEQALEEVEKTGATDITVYNDTEVEEDVTVPTGVTIKTANSAKLTFNGDVTIEAGAEVTGDNVIYAEGVKVTKYYAVTTEAEHGKVTVDKSSAQKDEVVKITVKADEGYELDKLYVDGKEQKELTFKMPGKDVVVKATFKKIAVQETTTEKTEEENPKTGDNILMYLSLGLASVAVSAVSVKKFRKSN